MNLKKVIPKILLIFILFYLLALYELVITPAVLEWSSLGVLLSIAVFGLLIFSLPAGKRIYYMALSIAFLMVNQALGNLQQSALLLTAAGYMLIFVVIYVVGRQLGKVALGTFTIVFVTAVLANLIFHPAEYPLWSEFAVKWQSPALYPKGLVDYFPVQVADVNDKAGAEILVQGNLERTEKSKTDQTTAGQELPLSGAEETIYYVFTWNGKTFARLPQSEYSVPKVAASVQHDFPNFPYYGAGFENSAAGVKQVLEPLFTPESLLQGAIEFGHAPFNTLVQDLENIGHFERNWQSFTRSVKINRGTAGGQQPVLGSTDIVKGDVDGNGKEDLMINTEYAKLLTYGPQGEPQVLWASPDESFRFEAFAPVGENKQPYIIARAKSQVRQNNARYITGYEYTSGGLVQKWRVFADLTGLTPGDVDGDGENELVGYLPNRHVVFVMEKHGLPVVAVLYVITAGLILFGFYRKFIDRNVRQGEVA